MLEAVCACAALELAVAGERDDALEGLARYEVKPHPRPMVWSNPARRIVGSQRKMLRA
jgi:hypothetical protein